MKKIVLSLIIFQISYVAAVAQEVVWSGDATLNAFWDTHDVIGGEDDLFLLWPDRKIIDKNGKDIHAVPKFNMSAMNSRLRCDIKGPNIGDFTARAQIEAMFLGAYQSDVSIFIMRYAYGSLKNDRHEFIFGQYWHPLSHIECSPQVLSFNGGSPIALYALDPQFRYTYRKNSFEFIGAILEQSRGYESPGPIGISPLYLRRAILPNVHAQMRYITDSRTLALGLDYKQLAPRVVNKKCNSVFERVHNVSALVSFAQKTRTVDICTQFLYAQNAVDLQSIGGYAVINQNFLSGERTYEPIQAVNGWIDINVKKIKGYFSPGIFLGVVKALGTISKICVFDTCGRPITYGYTNLDFVARISPRLVWEMRQLRIGFEVEYTSAAYGKLDDHARVRHGRYVDNWRVLFVMNYAF